MKWEERERSQNVDDRRGSSATKVGGGIGIGALLMIGLYLFMGQDPSAIIQQTVQQQQQQQTQSQGQPGSRADDELADFVSVVLKDTENVWNTIFRQQLQKQYQEPVLVIFDGQVSSACGHASAATGPFYCPGDNKLYLDLSFYRDIKNRFKVPGDADFALAYVVAHEVAHHIQNLLGITRDVQTRQRQLPKTEANELSVRLELQADFLAGVWAHHNQNMTNFLEEGDIEEAINAAHAIGDDRIQKESRGYVVPDSFTHGTSAQRIKWFSNGLKTGDIGQSDTFSMPYSQL